MVTQLMSNLKPIPLKFRNLQRYRTSLHFDHWHHAMQRTAVEHHCCQHRTVVLLVLHGAALPASGSPPRWILSPGLLACDRPAAKPLPKVSRCCFTAQTCWYPGRKWPGDRYRRRAGGFSRHRALSTGNCRRRLGIEQHCATCWHSEPERLRGAPRARFPLVHSVLCTE